MDKIKIKTNRAGYIQVPHKDWGYRGDVGSWIRVDTDPDGNQISVTARRSYKGIISSAYEQAMREEIGRASCRERV